MGYKNAKQLSASQRIVNLKDQAVLYDGSFPLVLLVPESFLPSHWPNTLQSYFVNAMPSVA